MSHPACYDAMLVLRPQAWPVTTRKPMPHTLCLKSGEYSNLGVVLLMNQMTFVPKIVHSLHTNRLFKSGTINWRHLYSISVYTLVICNVCVLFVPALCCSWCLFVCRGSTQRYYCNRGSIQNVVCCSSCKSSIVVISSGQPLSCGLCCRILTLLSLSWNVNLMSMGQSKQWDLSHWCLWTDRQTDEWMNRLTDWQTRQYGQMFVFWWLSWDP